MVLLSGEVETLDRRHPQPMQHLGFRMVLLSGEVETRCGSVQCREPGSGSGWFCYPGKLKLEVGPVEAGPVEGSGWFCYPGKLKPSGSTAQRDLILGSGWFCYPGKLKLLLKQGQLDALVRFRMVLLSGEVETRSLRLIAPKTLSSGWFCYPGKLKRQFISVDCPRARGSGWFCYPGKLKPDLPDLLQAGAIGSGWFCYPGKLKLSAREGFKLAQAEFRMVLLSGEVETSSAMPASRRRSRVPDGFAIRGS